MTLPIDAPGAVTDRPNPNRFYQGEWPVGDYRFFQIAWVVDDLLAAARKWVDVYGVGPFHVLPRRASTVRYRGQETSLEMQIAVAQSGPVQIELIQQTSETASVYREIFPAGTGGLHHLCTVTQAFDDTKAHYERLGYPSIASASSPAMRVEYFDTHKDFGVITELVEHTPGFIATLAAISETCAHWDGRDPIRLLTRDGYRVPEAA
jgi:hypothetical protein